MAFIRRMAGFEDRAGGFFLPRACVEPPESLQSLIWPELDHFHSGAFGIGEGRIDDVAGASFAKLLFAMRRIILQDSIELKEMFPHSGV